MSKTFYNNIIILTSQKGRDKIIEESIKTESIQNRIKNKDLILITNGGSKEVSIQDTEYGEYVKTLNLKCAEKYTNLARKTHQSIKYCCDNFRFNRIHKADDNKEIDESYYDFNKNDFDFQGSQIVRRPRNRGIRRLNRQKNACRKFPSEMFSQGLKKTSKKDFKKWARIRNIDVKPWLYDEHVWYSDWKPYSLSYKFANIFAQAGKYAKFYCENLAGCEDHMVGKVYKDLQLYFNLTSE